MLYHKLNIIKNGLTRYTCLFIALFFIVIAGFVNCADIAPTIQPALESEPSPPQNYETLYPGIQSVYPGTLQTLDIPKSYPTNVDTSAADIIVVFTHEMENDSNEIAQQFALYENLASVSIPISILPAASSRYFIIRPLSGTYKENSYYSLRIYKFAYVNDDTGRTLEFDSLVEIPASTLSPANTDYVVYTFRTGSSADTDTQPPVLLATNPGNGEKNVDPGLSPGGYIEIVFLDNVVPMIFPASVDANTINLQNATDDPAGNNMLDIGIELNTSDSDFKTFKVFPLDNLENGKNYKLIISVDNFIQDFQGNTLSETSIFFDTAPIP